MEDTLNIDAQNIWIDVSTLATLKNRTPRAIRLSLPNNKYIYKVQKNKSSDSYKIQLSSIEPELQSKYLSQYYQSILSNEPVELTGIKEERVIPEQQKKLALAKMDLVRFWLKFREDYKPRTRADKDFIILYNTGELYKNIYELVNNVSIGSLYRWKTLLNSSLKSDWTALVPNYNYTTKSNYRTSLSKEEIKIFLKILLSQNRFSIGKAIMLTKHILTQRGAEVAANDITFRRYANWYKKANYDKWIFAREGHKALKDKVESYIVRDTSVIEVGQILIADGHKLNFRVINPFTGKPCRATLLGFLDWKSGALVGYEIMLEECTQNIASALRNAILTMNKIPSYIYQDNGRAFKSKFFNGDKDFEELGFTGIYEKLGITPVYAVPYNARAKVIERFFLDFQEGFEKLIPSYIGTSIDNKPAYMKRNEKFHNQIHNEYIPTIEQAYKMIEAWLKLKHSQRCTNVKGKTIQEVLDEVKKQKININELDDLMMAQEVKTIGRNGIRFLKSDYCDDALYGIREKVIIKYSLFDLSYVKVYSMNGEFLCKANRVTSTHPLAHYFGDIKDIEDYKQKITKQHKLRNKTLKAVKEHFNIEDLNVLEKELTCCPALISESQDCESLKLNSASPAPTVSHNSSLVGSLCQIQGDIRSGKIKDCSASFVKPEKTEEIPILRPIFKNNIERYEWYLKNGCQSQTDRDWFKEFKNTSEYKEFYE